MTREERLDWLCRLRSEIYVFMPREWIKPMDEALTDSIKALEQPIVAENTTTEQFGNSDKLDCVSRQFMYEIGATCIATRNENGKLIALGAIEELPSVNPQEPKTEWIPVSERLPEEGKTVIASVKGSVYPEARYVKGYGWEWAYESGADYWEELEDVTAWQPLPKPYQGEVEQ